MYAMLVGDNLSPAQLAEAAAQPGFALLRDGSSWRLYREPQEALAPTDKARLPIRSAVSSAISKPVDKRPGL